MSADRRAYVSPNVLFTLAGVEAGVLGGIAMFAAFTAFSLINRGSLWTVPNLLASILYSRTVLRASFGMPTVAGLALLIAAAGAIGAVFGLVAGRQRSRLRVTLLAILASLLWFYFSQAVFWTRFARIHFPPISSLAAHLAFGFVLARYPARLAGVRRHFGLEEPPEPATSPPGEPEGHGTPPADAGPGRTPPDPMLE